MSLEALSAKVQSALAKLGEPLKPWTNLPPGFDAAVLIIGAGQSGLAAAFALKRAGVAPLRVISADPIGEEGPWRSFARMPTLRSPKKAPGPELGLPELTYESWHTARYGAADYAALGLIPTAHWAAYLDWFREAAGITVEPGWHMTSLTGDADGVNATLKDGATIRARQVVLATGMAALGGPIVPDILQSLPRHLYATTTEAIDFAALKGKCVAVLGAASSAFDNAAEALEAGAAQVDLYCRRKELNAINRMKGVADYGLVAHWADLDDARRWHLARHTISRAAPPTGPTVARACRWPNFAMLMEAPWQAAKAEGAGIAIQAQGAWRRYDFALAGVGYGIDAAARPELAEVFQYMARWRDAFAPPPGDADARLGGYPYLTPGFAFMEVEAGAAPWLSRVRLFAGPAVLSMGRIVGESGNLRYGVPRLATAITEALALEDADRLIARAEAFDERDTVPADYVANIARAHIDKAAGDGV